MTLEHQDLPACAPACPVPGTADRSHATRLWKNSSLLLVPSVHYGSSSIHGT